MIYELFMADVILTGLVLLMFLIGGIKLFKPIKQWFEHQIKLEASVIEGQKIGTEEEKIRIGRILKNEYNIAKQQNNEEVMKIIIKINKLMKQEEETP